MKRIEKEGNRLKDIFRKKPSVGIFYGIVIVLLISLTVLFSLKRLSKDTNLNKPVNTSSQNTADGSAVNYASQMRLAEYIDFTYPDDAAAAKQGTILYSKSSQSNFDEISASVSKVLEFLPSSPSEESFGKGKLIKIDCILGAGSSLTISVFKPADDSKTVFEVQSDDNNSVQYYSCDSSVYDEVFEIIKPYTLDAAKTTADTFLKAFAGKDTKTIESLEDNSGYISKWKIMSDTGGAIQNVTCEPLAGSSNAFKVSFDVGAGDSYPFSSGHNERILEIGRLEIGTNGAVCFVEASKYTKPQTEPEIQCEQLCRTVAQSDFQSASDLKSSDVLNYILQYETGSINIINPTGYSEDINYFTQADIDNYAKSLFGLNHIDGSKSQYYDINGDSYRHVNNFGGSINKHRFIQTTEDKQGYCSVTIEFYSDSLETIERSTLRYDLEKNADGSYRFVRGVTLS